MFKHIVKKDSRFKPKHYFVFFTIVIITTIFYLHDNPRLNAIRTQLSQAHDINTLLNENIDLREQKKELSEKNMKLMLLADVDNETSVKLQNQIKSLQEQIFNLTRELKFYQGIITASSYSNGLNIQGLHIETTQKKGFFRYKLVLTNIGKSDKVAEVSVDMKVEGSDNSGFRTLKLNDISSGTEYKNRIKIRNFERIEGNFNMPDGFEPLRVLVDLKQHGGEKLRLHRVFEWQIDEV